MQCAEWMQMLAAMSTGHEALIGCNDLTRSTQLEPSLSGEMADEMVHLQLHVC